MTNTAQDLVVEVGQGLLESVCKALRDAGVTVDGYTRHYADASILVRTNLTKDQVQDIVWKKHRGVWCRVRKQIPM